MAFASGVFTLDATLPVTGTTISSTWAATTLNGIATGLTTCLLKDGTQAVTGNITLSGYNLLNTPVHIGGNAAGSTMELRTTSGVGSGDYIKFTGGSNGAVEVARFLPTANATGRIIFGATAPIGSEQISIQDNGNKSSLYVNNATATQTGYMVAIVASGIAAGTGYKLLAGGNSGGDCFYIFGNGNVQNTNNSYGAISDAKFKTVIGRSGSQWEDVKALGALITKFTLNADPEKKQQIGWIAQEVQKISPGLVYSVPDYEGEDEARQMVGETLGVQYSVAYIKAFKALGEALERIEALEAKFA